MLAGQAHRVDDAWVTIDALHEGALTAHDARARLHHAQLSVSAALATKQGLPACASFPADVERPSGQGRPPRHPHHC